ncbi:EpsG family protein [Eubacterium ruminantium]|uniref:EpsG family protein n=1 Tax=Eubacterium ruminantium TaxID=42322 RepID=A0A1T4LS21_9FIRM|nr:EpsG family protein [Eubacterium ruminantium]SCW40157.1 EpsG family protein [Eubacterium ruminantium]SDM40279.1 EpsG family protein [Eubacterium ruminantium]SJZ57416.1 EpsG family protein [Eubacterium ruminantium]
MSIDFLKIGILIIFIYASILNLHGKINVDQRKRRLFCAFATIVLSVLTALRADSVGSDTSAYIYEYNNYSNYSFLMIIKSFPSCWGYYSVGKIFHGLGCDVHLWFFFIAFCFNAVVFYFIYKNSEDIILSFILYISTGIFSFSMSGQKQVCAMTLCILAYNIYLNKEKRLIPVIIIIIGSFFHQTALIFMVALFIKNLKINKINNLIALSVSIIVFISGSTILRNFITALANAGNRFGYYQNNISNYSLTIFFIQLMIVFVYCIYFKSINESNYSGFFYCSIISLLFFFLNKYVSSMFRIGYYFLFFNYILFPNSVCSENDSRTRVLLKLGAGTVFLTYFIIFSNINYQMFI